MELHYRRSDVLNFLLTSDKTSSSMQTAPLYFLTSTFIPPVTGTVLDVSPVCWPPSQPHSEYTGGKSKTPIWSFSIKRDLLEAKQICQLLTKVSARPADHTEPIRRLTPQETKFNWTKEHKKASREVKILLWLPPHYLAITTQRPSLKCDALLQRGKPIAHWDSEKRYARIKKELLAIVFSLDRFLRKYTYGRHVKIKKLPKDARIHPEEVSRVCAKTPSRYDDETSEIWLWGAV